MAGGVFINYRRALNLRDAQLLQKALQRHFGQRGVFLDVSGLDGGDHWLHTLEKQVDASAAMVALIGRGWSDVTEKGTRRLDNPNDFVRFELARAFSRSMPVLPVLIDGAEVPDVSQLPTNLLPLTFPQAMHLRSESLDDDVDKIARRLRYLIAQSRRSGLSYLSAGAWVAIALALGVAMGPMLLNRLGLPFPGVTLPSDERLGADLDAARDNLAKAVRERDGLRGELASSQKQLDAAKAAAAQSAAVLAAAGKARDDALAEAKGAKADAEGWRQKHAALDGQVRAEDKRKEEAARRDPALTVQPGSGKIFRDCNDGCPELVVVPKGRFKMGEGAGAREVAIPQPFAIGKFEVTFDEWGACVAGGGCTGNRNPDDRGWGKGRRPVINVSWNDAKEYVAWLSRKTGKTYRLLSEAEWEYAARAGSTTAYTWGDDIGKGNANCSSCGSQWDNKQTAPVGSFGPNVWGLQDMHGNVWEWCEDAYDASSRVLRGGSWVGIPDSLRSASAAGSGPTSAASLWAFVLPERSNTLRLYILTS